MSALLPLVPIHLQTTPWPEVLRWDPPSGAAPGAVFLVATAESGWVAEAGLDRRLRPLGLLAGSAWAGFRIERDQRTARWANDGKHWVQAIEGSFNDFVIIPPRLEFNATTGVAVVPLRGEFPELKLRARIWG